MMIVSAKKMAHFSALFSFLLGALGVFAFAPFHLYPLIIISLAGLLWIFLHSTAKQAFRRGFCYGLGFFGLGIHWVYISIHAFGNAPAFFSILLTLLFISILALFPGLVGLTLNRYFPSKLSITCWLFFPALWTLSEWIRSWAFTGFPWLLIGNSQTIAPLAHLATVGGVYLISFALAQLSAAVVYFFKEPVHRLYTLSYVSLLFISASALSFVHWTKPNHTPVQVSLVQGNITPSLKWQPGEAERQYQHYLTLSNTHWDKRLIIWPEAAIATSGIEAKIMLDQLTRLSERHHAGLITGVPYINNEHYYNSALALGQAKGMYLKRHLVPFGEYFPVTAFTKPLLYWLNIPMSDFKAGGYNQVPILYQNTLFSTFICYESAFPEEVRQTFHHANVILILSDDAWFGHSFAQAQHLQMAQMRAIETGRYVLSATNNGVTAIISPDGHIIKSLPSYEEGVLSGEVIGYQGDTPWLKYGSNIYLLICILSLIIGRILSRRQNHST